MKIVESMTGSGKSAWPAASPYYTDADHPQAFRLPHNAWRPHQLETLRWLVDEPGSVIVLTRTKALQRQYGNAYGATILYGRANYKCCHPDTLGTTCAECQYQTHMHKCDFAGRCEYLLAKDAAKASAFMSLSYAYWLSASWSRKDERAYVYMDEGHNLSSVVLDWSGCRVTEKQRVDWGLPAFPHVEHQARNVLLRLPEPTDLALEWLRSAREVMATHYKQLGKQAKMSQEARERLAKCEQLGRKLTATRVAIESCSDEWYIRSGLRGLMYGKQPVPGLLCRPLTAKNHFAGYFCSGSQLIAMSATIGDPVQFAAELGITDYAFRSVPSRFAPERRLIHVLDCPSMSAKANDADFEHQADAIAKFVKRYPPYWSGLIHVSRITEEKLLHDRLCRRGLADRVFYIRSKQESYTPTDAQLKAWQRRKRHVPNSLLVTCSFGEGYDGLDERINISAKIPYRRYGSEKSYDRAWATYSHKRYAQDAGVSLMQQLGRTRRGREEDYDTADEVRGACAVVDGSVGRVKGYLSESFREALRI